MSGHSKWHSIKHKKGAADAKRGKIFTRIIKELTVAARAGGGDPDSNPRLRTIIAEAKQNNMPAENIKRAIRRGTGEEPGVSYDEAQYEGYGPGGAALIIDTLTDNKNRTVGELRHLLEKHGGNLAAVHEAVKALGIEPAAASVSMIPQNYVKLEGKTAQQMVRLMEALEDHDDVQHVYSNFDIEEKEIEASLA